MKQATTRRRVPSDSDAELLLTLLRGVLRGKPLPAQSILFGAAAEPTFARDDIESI